VEVGRIQQRILLIRGEKVIIDEDLAEFYGVSRKRLNEQVKRNQGRSPEDFMFQLSGQSLVGDPTAGKRGRSLGRCPAPGGSKRILREVKSCF